ncbi:DUF1674 domain-containing protein [Wenzhouxiangella sp. EGI_FJ10305]|uniref:DUF1674 domain-containing protein n=1 Tax=Wenzhouxiangella sp. EGI_FJ10305 TaxID=3243768 RepID=UPI0035D5C82D
MSGYNSTSSGTNPDQHAAEADQKQGNSDESPVTQPEVDRPREFGGRKNGLEPTRYGDWEKDGRCIDF